LQEISVNFGHFFAGLSQAELHQEELLFVSLLVHVYGNGKRFLLENRPVGAYAIYQETVSGEKVQK